MYHACGPNKVDVVLVANGEYEGYGNETDPKFKENREKRTSYHFISTGIYVF